MAVGRHVLDAIRSMANTGVRWLGGCGGTNSKQRQRRAQSRRDKGRAKFARTQVNPVECPPDERNPTMIGNRRLRAVAERHGTKAVRKLLARENRQR